MVRDVETSGGMHENYDAETGAPLAAPNAHCSTVAIEAAIVSPASEVASPEFASNQNFNESPNRTDAL